MPDDRTDARQPTDESGPGGEPEAAPFTLYTTEDLRRMLATAESYVGMAENAARGGGVSLRANGAVAVDLAELGRPPTAEDLAGLGIAAASLAGAHAAILTAETVAGMADRLAAVAERLGL